MKRSEAMTEIKKLKEQNNEMLVALIEITRTEIKWDNDPEELINLIEDIAGKTWEAIQLEQEEDK